MKRGNVSGEIWLEDLYNGHATNIAILPGDQIFVSEDTRNFSVMGELAGQGLVTFPKARLSALEGITLAGGLNTAAADPKGVFILRDETPALARVVLNDPKIKTDKRLVYVFDLTKPDALFKARDMQLRNGDTILVTEAPYTQWTKILNALLTTTSAADNISNVANN